MLENLGVCSASGFNCTGPNSTYPNCDAGLKCNTNGDLTNFEPLNYTVGTFPTELALFPTLTSMYAPFTTRTGPAQIRSILASKALSGSIPNLSALVELQNMYALHAIALTSQRREQQHAHWNDPRC
jgi:hypothetical protein